MKKTKITKLIKEFKRVHNSYSLSRNGYWQKSWNKIAKLKGMDLVNGFWYWKGYKIAGLLEKLGQKQLS